MRHKPWVPWAFLAAPLLLYSIWVIYPTISTFDSCLYNNPY